LASIIRGTNAGECAAPTAYLCRTALVAMLISTTMCAAADSKQASWNRRAELKKAGYVELIGADVAHFLVGNSVLIQKSSPLDSEKYGIEIYPAVYYFLSDHTMYECGVGKEADCFVRPWGVVNNQICLDTVALCNEPTGIAIMKSPFPKKRAKSGGKIGVYVSFGHYVYDIVKGDRVDGPFFDSHVSGQPIELNRADFAKEVEDASQRGAPDKAVPISGPRAISLLIGNTFLSDDAIKPSKDQTTNACPEEGTYYSPDGRVIRFTCHEQMWSISILHWKIRSGLICRDGPDPRDIGVFDFCKPATVKVIFAAQGSGAGDTMLVQDLESGNALTGYAGNVLKFRVERHLEVDKSDSK
jgi:hypothetical protein